MEKILYAVIPIFVFIISLVIGIIGWLIVRLIKGFDERIIHLENRTEDISAIREAIEWIREELNGRQKRRK